MNIPAGIYLLKVNSINTRAMCEVCSKLTVKTPERYHIVNFEHVITGLDRSIYDPIKHL